MKRRKFTSALTAIAASPLLLSSAPTHKRRKRVKRIKPARLKVGDTIGLIAPASGIRDGQLDRARMVLDKLELKVKVGQFAEAQNGFLAGLDHQRVDDIHNMLTNDAINGIWCIRGGYGLSRIVSDFKRKYFLQNPKLIIGYSDVTVLNQYAATIGLVTVHGQIAGTEYTDEVFTNMKQLIFGNLTGKTIRPFEGAKKYTITGGQAQGQLSGGNLSLLSALAGTPYIDSFKNKIVFIEDVGEKPYRIDRMLTQLIDGSDLKQAKAIVLGEFADCDKKEGDKSWSLQEVLVDRLKPLGMPVCYGIPFGHVDQNMAMPMLTEVSVDADQISMTYKEEAVA